ncbi:MAG: hypothetical protein ACOX5Q_08570 [Bacillota bacterium]|jgi:hypothetical protein|nr:DUF370 domain-containing protein [Candidatus Fermentithermobacillaceae bacterium]
MEPWIELGPENVIHAGDIIAVIDWTHGKTIGANRELVGYARAHEFLVEDSGEQKASLVIARDRVFLLKASTRSIRKKLDRT